MVLAWVPGEVEKDGPSTWRGDEIISEAGSGIEGARPTDQAPKTRGRKPRRTPEKISSLHHRDIALVIPSQP